MGCVWAGMQNQTLTHAGREFRLLVVRDLDGPRTVVGPGFVIVADTGNADANRTIALRAIAVGATR